MRDWIETFFRYVTPFTIIVAVVIFEATETPYSALMTAAFVNSLALLGINVYGKVKR